MKESIRQIFAEAVITMSLGGRLSIVPLEDIYTVGLFTCLTRESAGLIISPCSPI